MMRYFIDFMRGFFIENLLAIDIIKGLSLTLCFDLIRPGYRPNNELYTNGFLGSHGLCGLNENISIICSAFSAVMEYSGHMIHKFYLRKGVN